MGALWISPPSSQARILKSLDYWQKGVEWNNELKQCLDKKAKVLRNKQWSLNASQGSVFDFDCSVLLKLEMWIMAS